MVLPGIHAEAGEGGGPKYPTKKKRDAPMASSVEERAIVSKQSALNLSG